MAYGKSTKRLERITDFKVHEIGKKAIGRDATGFSGSSSKAVQKGKADLKGALGSSWAKPEKEYREGKGGGSGQ